MSLSCILVRVFPKLPLTSCWSCGFQVRRAGRWRWLLNFIGLWRNFQFYGILSTLNQQKFMYYSQLAEGSSESLSASRGRHRRITCNEYFTLSLLISNFCRFSILCWQAKSGKYILWRDYLRDFLLSLLTFLPCRLRFATSISTFSTHLLYSIPSTLNFLHETQLKPTSLESSALT